MVSDVPLFAIVTGASKGIGFHLASELARRRFNLLLVARSEDLLELASAELRNKFGVEVLSFAVDLTSPTSINRLILYISENKLAVSVLVNNAGLGLFGSFARQEYGDIRKMILLNIEALTSLTHALIPLLRESRPACILNVASTAAFQAIPYMGVYAATKAFVLSFSRALRFELKASGINVSCLCPGPVETDFWERAKLSSVERIRKISKDPEEIARAGIAGMLAGKSEIVVGSLNWIGAIFSRFFPKVIVENITARLFRD